MHNHSKRNDNLNLLANSMLRQVSCIKQRPQSECWRIVFLCLLSTSLYAFPKPSAGKPPTHWTTTWGSAQLRAEGASNLPKQPFNGATLRQTVRISIGGDKLRLRLSNAFGESSLVVQAVSIAAAGKAGAIDPHTQFPALFHGSENITVPAGAEYLSDAIPMTVPPLADLTITLFIDRVPSNLTSHSDSLATSYLAPGNHVLEAELPSPESFPHWFFLAGVEVQGASNAGTVVALGDSITDGYRSETDANGRWPNVLAARLSSAHLGVVNQGIGGNRILEDGLGPNLLARFDRDVLTTAGARYLIVLEGINDLGVLDRTETHSAATHDAQLKALEAAFAQTVARAHTQGLTVFGGTLTPFIGSDYYHPSAQTESDSNALNRWIKTSGTFDGVIDFDSAMRDPAHPGRLDPAVDCGDHLHPNTAGYKRMGELVPLSLFKQAKP